MNIKLTPFYGYWLICLYTVHYSIREYFYVVLYSLSLMVSIPDPSAFQKVRHFPSLLYTCLYSFLSPSLLVRLCPSSFTLPVSDGQCQCLLVYLDTSRPVLVLYSSPYSSYRSTPEPLGAPGSFGKPRRRLSVLLCCLLDGLTQPKNFRVTSLTHLLFGVPTPHSIVSLVHPPEPRLGSSRLSLNFVPTTSSFPLSPNANICKNYLGVQLRLSNLLSVT